MRSTEKGPSPGAGGGVKEGFLVEVIFTLEVFLKEVIYTWEGCKGFKVGTPVRLGGVQRQLGA